MLEPITIIGGGLAGLTLGIGLRRLGIPVTVWEAGRYPRHRVCGEFISGSGQYSLERLDLLRGLQTIGRLATDAAFFHGKWAGPIHLLPQPGWCVSRYVLDEQLALEFQRLGGQLRAGERWRGSFGPGIVRATGRRPAPVDGNGRLFGLKVHAREVSLGADLEMHMTPSGYVGLCRLPGDEVNICGLFSGGRRAVNGSQAWRDWLSGSPGSVLHDRLADARFDETTFCSVAGLSLRPQRAAELTECCVGDAVTMTPPVTGNGMSMAFESAELAMTPLAQFSRGKRTWAESHQQIADACDARFERRLRWAGWLQPLLFHPLACAPLGLAARARWLWRLLFKRTR